MNEINKILEFSKLEKQYAEELRKLGESIKHPVLKTLFLSIAKDSEKHSLMYEAIHQVLTQTQPFISEEELKRIAQEIQKHIETEAKMLEEAEKILSSSQDPRIKLLASAIVEDEAKHHALLQSIKKRIAEEETLSEKILWDMIWKDSPWHGTPGG